MKLQEINNTHILYHGSKKQFPIGFILKPQPGFNYEPEEKAVERILEYFRPPSKLNRKQSVYLVEKPDHNLIERVGGDADYIYEVSVNSFEKNDVHWWAEILDNGAIDFMDGNKDALKWCKDMALSYWNGSPSSKPSWEFRSPFAKIIRNII